MGWVGWGGWGSGEEAQRPCEPAPGTEELPSRAEPVREPVKHQVLHRTPAACNGSISRSSEHARERRVTASAQRRREERGNGGEIEQLDM